LIVEIVVAQESHKDGEPHLHAYIRLQKQYNSRGKHDKLTIQGHYPNVQSVNNKLKVIHYITKEDKEPFAEGIDPSQYVHAHEHHG